MFILMNVIRHTFSVPSHVSEKFCATVPAKERSKAIAAAMIRIADAAEKQKCLELLELYSANGQTVPPGTVVETLRGIREDAP